LLVGSVLLISVVFGVLISALLEASEFLGRGIVRVMLISPFFIMPTVGADLEEPDFPPGLGDSRLRLEAVRRRTGGLAGALPAAVDHHHCLVAMAALRDPDPDDRHAVPRPGTEGSRAPGRCRPVAIFWHLTLPHLARPIAVVVMIETIFLLSVFAEIFTTTNGGPGYASTNLAYLIYNQALVQFDVGMASAGGLIAVVIANIAAIILVRMIGKNLTDKA
jgi:sorbitol/mannitol transport system permease protein